MLLLWPNLALLQTTLYSEDFTGQADKGAIGPGTTDVTGVTTWSITTDFNGLTATTDWFVVVNDGTGSGDECFQARDVDYEQIWTSSSINVTGYNTLDISMDVYQEGDLESGDYIDIYYILDGGTETLMGSYSDDFVTPSTFSYSGLSGSTLQIVVKILNNAGAEKISFDNVLVTGTNSSTANDVSDLTTNSNQVVSFTDASGCVDDYLAIASTSSITTTPSGDGSAYTASNTYGNGTNVSGTEYVVYSGTTNSFSLNGLTLGTEYCVKVFTRCGTDWSDGVEYCFTPETYNDTLVIMAYNVLNYPGSTPERWEDFRTIVQYVQPDIILCNEMVSATGANTLLTNALNAYGATNYLQATFIDGPDSDNIMYYNSDKVSLNTQDEIATDLRDINYYQVTWTNNSGGQSYLDLYSLHLKASTGTTNENRRLTECQDLRTHMDGVLPLASNIIVGGDFNFYGATSEPAWTELTATGIQLLQDPKNRVGDWHNDGTYADVHTQSTRSTTNPGGSGGSTGGLDDRFDFLLVNNYVMNGGNGVKYITDSYDEVGNDENKFNFSIIENLPNTAVPDSVRDALFNMSDHLPVILSIEIDSYIELLPIELISFNGELNRLNQVDLEWITASEINSDYYIIQKSSNGIDFEYLAQIQAAGNSSVSSYYNAVDESPVEGINYYRLLQVDFDGTVNHVKTISITFTPERLNVLIYPNPTQDNTFQVLCDNLKGDFLQLDVKNILGQTVYSETINIDSHFINQSISLPDDLPADMYFVTLKNENKQYSQKLILQK